jgi:uncharacterized protein (TIGR02145 family)
MAENLDYSVDSSWCYSNSADSCAKYGRLYQWAAMMGLEATYNKKLWRGILPHQGICPNGWHVPSDSEWTMLTSYTGGKATSGPLLKSTGGWNNSGKGTDNYGFRALPGGVIWGTSKDIGYYGYWSSATELDESNAWYRYIGFSYIYVSRFDNQKSYGLSLRCIQD